MMSSVGPSSSSNGQPKTGEPTPLVAPRSLFSTLAHGLCPRCRRGRIFSGSLEMNRRCPVCQLSFQREPGYFLGAMYISYPLATLILGVFFFIGLMLLPDWGYHWILLLAMIPFLPFVPWIFRMSRVLWIHFERGASLDDFNG
jgi:uncharacterized protein (DUF983 family)